MCRDVCGALCAGVPGGGESCASGVSGLVVCGAGGGDGVVVGWW